MSLKLGSTLINKMHLGSAEIKKAYLGSTVVFDNTAVPLWDGVSVIYELERPDMTTLWTNAIYKIRRDSDGATSFLFLLNNSSPSKGDTYTLGAFISTTSDTSESATTLSTWMGANGGWVERQYGMTDDNTISVGKRAIQTVTSLQPQFANSSGVILTKNGKPSLDFLSDLRYLEASPNSDLDSIDDFTMLTVTHNNKSADIGAFLTLSTNFKTFNMHSNRHLTALRISHIFNNVGTLFETALISAQNNADQKLLTTIINSGTMSSYYNSTFQESVNFTGTYLNDKFLIGRRFDTGAFDIGIQLIAILPSDIGGDRTTKEADIISRYSIP